MKTTFTAATAYSWAGMLAGLSLAGSATADFTTLSTTVTATDAVEGGYAIVHVWAEFDGAGDHLTAISGDSNIALSITTTDPAGFYQNAFGSDHAKGINAGVFTLFPSLAADTWVTIGCLDQDGTMSDGTSISGGNVESIIGDVEFDEETPAALTAVNGAVFITPDDAQGTPIDGKVLIGQFTVIDRQDYVVSGSVNLLYEDEEDGSLDANGATFTVTVDTFESACDFNEDNYADLVWQGMSGSHEGKAKVYHYNGPDADGDYDSYEYISNTNVWTEITSWLVVGYGDFDQDGHQDILFQGTSAGDNGKLKIFYFDGAGNYDGSQIIHDATTKDCRGVADVNGDGNLDVVMQETMFASRGEVTVVFLDAPDADTPYDELGTQILFEGYTSWLVRCVTDWDDDGNVDLVWQGLSGSDRGKTKVFFYDAPDADTPYDYLGSETLLGVTNSWIVRGTRDFDQDGHDDLLWQGTSAGDRGKVKVYKYTEAGYNGSFYLFDSYTSWIAR